MNIFQRWRMYADRFYKAFGPEVLEDFTRNTAARTRQQIAKDISFRQKLISIMTKNGGYEENSYATKAANKYNFIIDQLMREDRFYRLYEV